jgi:polyadenylate-binding protein
MRSDNTRVLRIVDLPASVTEDEILGCMNQAADRVVHIRLAKEADDESLCLGYGYIHFQTVDDASRALEKYQGKSIGGTGRRFNLSFAKHIEGVTVDLFQVYVGGLPASMTSEELFHFFKKFSDEVSNAYVATDGIGQSKKYGFAQFRSDESARKTISKLSLMETGFIIRETHTPSRAEIQRQVDHIHNTVIFIGNLNLSLSDVDLHASLSRFGHIQSVRIVPGKGFGFVQFADHISALAALSELQNSELFHQKVHCSWGQMREGMSAQPSTIGSRPTQGEEQQSMEYHASMLPRPDSHQVQSLHATISSEHRVRLLEASLRTLGSTIDDPPLKSIDQINSDFIIRKFRS